MSVDQIIAKFQRRVTQPGYELTNLNGDLANMLDEIAINLRRQILETGAISQTANPTSRELSLWIQAAVSAEAEDNAERLTSAERHLFLSALLRLGRDRDRRKP